MTETSRWDEETTGHSWDQGWRPITARGGARDQEEKPGTRARSWGPGGGTCDQEEGPVMKGRSQEPGGEVRYPEEKEPWKRTASRGRDYALGGVPRRRRSVLVGSLHQSQVKLELLIPQSRLVVSA